MRPLIEGLREWIQLGGSLEAEAVKVYEGGSLRTTGCRVLRRSRVGGAYALGRTARKAIGVRRSTFNRQASGDRRHLRLSSNSTTANTSLFAVPTMVRWSPTHIRVRIPLRSLRVAQFFWSWAVDAKSQRVEEQNPTVTTLDIPPAPHTVSKPEDTSSLRVLTFLRMSVVRDQYKRALNLTP